MIPSLDTPKSEIDGIQWEPFEDAARPRRRPTKRSRSREFKRQRSAWAHRDGKLDPVGTLAISRTHDPTSLGRACLTILAPPSNQCNVLLREALDLGSVRDSEVDSREQQAVRHGGRPAAGASGVPCVTYLLAAMALSLGLAACATLPNGKPARGDPFERVNRSIWKFDYALDKSVLRPVARAYTHLPHPIRRVIHNFITNFEYPHTAINDFLQGKFEYAANDVTRLVVNTVLGVGGLFDPASHMDLDRHDADFGQTLGVWGLKTGPFLMLPILGPSDVRDAFGQTADTYMEPYAYISNLYVSGGIDLVSKIDERSELLGQDRLIDSAYDPYALVRSAYLQNRRFKVHGTSITQSETPDQLFPELDTSDTAPPVHITGRPRRPPSSVPRSGVAPATASSVSAPPPASP